MAKYSISLQEILKLKVGQLSRSLRRFTDPSTMYLTIQGYLQQLPGALKETVYEDGSAAQVCIYTPHSLRAMTATLLLDAGVDIRKVQDLLGHRHTTTTHIYDKRRRSTG